MTKRIKTNKRGPDGYEDDDPSDPDFPAGKLTQVPNFLPPPAELFPPGDDMVKVTIALKKASVDFFKAEARKHRTKYQRMIRNVIDRYAERYQKESRT